MQNFYNKKAYLFDLDGTVIASKQGIFNALYYTFDKLKMERPNEETAHKFIGPSIGASLINLYSFSEQDAEDAVAIYREYYSTKGLLECEPYDGIETLLKTLKSQNKLVAIATKKPEMYAKKIIENLGFNKYFDIVAGSSPDEKHDDKSHIIKKAMDILDVSTDDSVMIGDTKYDVIGSKKANVDVIGVLYGYGSREELVEYNATAIANDMNELIKITTTY